MVSSLLSQSEVDYIKAGCLEDCRVDGRSCREFRHHNVLVSSSSSSSSSTSSSLLVRSNGSSRILLDGVHVLCSVKADIVTPPDHRPSHGVIELSVEHHPHATSSSGSSAAASSYRKSRNDDDVLQQLLEDLFLPHLLDLSTLCLVRGEFAWRLAIDVLVLATGGGASSGPGALLDAASLAVAAALHNTWLPTVTVVPKDDVSLNPNKAKVGDAMGSSHLGLKSSDALTTAELVVEGDMAKARRIVDMKSVDIDSNDNTRSKGQALNDSIQLLTVTIVKCHATSPNANEPPAPKFVCLLDATPDEVACSHCQIHVAVRTPQRSVGNNDSAPTSSSTTRASVCALQTSGGGSIHLSIISEATQLALKGAVDRPRCVEVTDLSLLASGSTSTSISAVVGTAARTQDETMLLQEMYALQ